MSSNSGRVPSILKRPTSPSWVAIVEAVASNGASKAQLRDRRNAGEAVVGRCRSAPPQACTGRRWHGCPSGRFQASGTWAALPASPDPPPPLSPALASPGEVVLAVEGDRGRPRRATNFPHEGDVTGGCVGALCAALPAAGPATPVLALRPRPGLLADVVATAAREASRSTQQAGNCTCSKGVKRAHSNRPLRTSSKGPSNSNAIEPVAHGRGRRAPAAHTAERQCKAKAENQAASALRKLLLAQGAPDDVLDLATCGDAEEPLCYLGDCDVADAEKPTPKEGGDGSNANERSQEASLGKEAASACLRFRMEGCKQTPESPRGTSSNAVKRQQAKAPDDGRSMIGPSHLQHNSISVPLPPDRVERSLAARKGHGENTKYSPSSASVAKPNSISLTLELT
eukprot:CAMPEP_0176192856 /NCGR_PEP_ID=MMETSP0121_2-20121125/5185_1 /TAXON_ID=160619 /ORGANISM="Kryptoperidinium foliaceum, Strain CCMP 1326" /LENGTH=398 /DNA_ID=CAMNT_0017531553 /DNA_START=303 /DNA_END=1503 /DNA_ORIENTATION=+